MKTLQEVKDEYAKTYGHKDWSFLMLNYTFFPQRHNDEVAKIYAKQCAEQALKDVKDRLNDFSIDFGGLSADYETMIDTTLILTP